MRLGLFLQLLLLGLFCFSCKFSAEQRSERTVAEAEAAVLREIYPHLPKLTITIINSATNAKEERTFVLEAEEDDQAIEYELLDKAQLDPLLAEDLRAFHAEPLLILPVGKIYNLFSKKPREAGCFPVLYEGLSGLLLEYDDFAAQLTHFKDVVFPKITPFTGTLCVDDQAILQSFTAEGPLAIPQESQRFFIEDYMPMIGYRPLALGLGLADDGDVVFAALGGVAAGAAAGMLGIKISEKVAKGHAKNFTELRTTKPEINSGVPGSSVSVPQKPPAPEPVPAKVDPAAPKAPAPVPAKPLVPAPVQAKVDPAPVPAKVDPVEPPFIPKKLSGLQVQKLEDGNGELRIWQKIETDNTKKGQPYVVVNDGVARYAQGNQGTCNPSSCTNILAERLQLNKKETYDLLREFTAFRYDKLGEVKAIQDLGQGKSREASISGEALAKSGGEGYQTGSHIAAAFAEIQQKNTPLAKKLRGYEMEAWQPENFDLFTSNRQTAEWLLSLYEKNGKQPMVISTKIKGAGGHAISLSNIYKNEKEEIWIEGTNSWGFDYTLKVNEDMFFPGYKMEHTKGLATWTSTSPEARFSLYPGAVIIRKKPPTAPPLLNTGG